MIIEKKDKYIKYKYMYNDEYFAYLRKSGKNKKC